MSDIETVKSLPESDFFYFRDLFSKPENLKLLFILIVVPFAVFWQATGFEFVWDDMPTHLVENPYLNPPSLKNLIHFWKEPYEGLYIPVSYNLWGVIKAMGFETPSAYHLVNIVLHTLNTLLVLTLLRQFIKQPLAAAAGALLFAVHPLQVESVAWVSEFRGLSAAFFGFSSLYFYLNACRQKYEFSNNSLWSRHWMLSWALFILALLSKPSAAVIPFFAVLLEYYRHRPSVKQMALHIWIFFAPIVVIAFITSSVQSHSQTYPFWLRPLIWMDAAAFYLYKLLLPVSLAASYARTPNYVTVQWWFSVIWIIPAGIGLLLWQTRKKFPLMGLSALLFIIGFLPVSGLVNFVFQAWSTVADRYLYFSMLGTGLFFAALCSRIREKWQWGIVFSVVAFFTIWSAIVQTPTWKDSIVLWNHCLKVTPAEFRAYTNRGIAYSRTKNYDKALQDYNKALSMGRPSSILFNNRGKIFATRKQFEKALSDFNSAIAIQPDYAGAYYNRGLLHVDKNEPQKAIADYTRAISIISVRPEFYSSRGVALARLKNFEQAHKDFDTAISLNPKFSDAYFNKAVTFFHQKKFKESQIYTRKSRQLGKEIPPAFDKALKENLILKD